MRQLLRLLISAAAMFAAAFFTGAMCRDAKADSFDWRRTSRNNFVTPIKSQGGVGTCWAFASTACLESKYMITRNDSSFLIPDLSEQQLVCDGVGTITGGSPYKCLNYYTSTGIVSEAELPYIQQSTSPDWPLQDGWEDRVVKSVSNSNFITPETESLKAALKAYGPLTVCVHSGEDLNTSTLGTSGINHAVLVVGYYDDPRYSGGGYWIIKNSWGELWSGNGYGKVMYGNVERHDRICAIDGAVYRTGPMATADWQGGTNVWAVDDNTNWTVDDAAYTWVNQETAAVFNANLNNQITISEKAIAHGLTFNPGATGYVFSGGSLTVTAGGITANESVTINVPVTVGAPQTWTAAAGKTLSIGGDVHTVISDLTVDGAGHTYVAGVIDGGGVINSLGAPAGNLIKDGTGILTIAGASHYEGAIAIRNGALRLTPAADATAMYSGVVSDAGTLVVAGAGRVVLSGMNSYTGLTTVAGGTLELVGVELDMPMAWAPVLYLGGADVQAGALVFNYTDGFSPAATIQAALADSYVDGWESGQIYSSTAAAAGDTALGWLDDGAGLLTVAYTLYGDLNLDYVVDQFDVDILVANYNTNSNLWSLGDLNYDGWINEMDYDLLKDNYGRSLPPVPEPPALLLAILGIFGVLGAMRRRRHS